MRRIFDLVHLTDITCPPPDFIYAAAEAGYDRVSVRTIPMGLAGEKPHNLATDPVLFQKTRRAVQESGVIINDTENARIIAGIDIKSYEPALAAAAELGVHQVLTNVWTDDKSFYIEEFSRLCELCRQYDQVVNIEFVTWAAIKDLKGANELIDASGEMDAGIVLDMLHYYRSRVSLEDIKHTPTGRIRCIHLCDCEAEIPDDEAALAHTAREERLYPGEGAVDTKAVVELIPDAILGIEVPHYKRCAEYGLVEHARRALIAAQKALP